MATQSISATILTVDRTAEQTILRIASGGNGSRREETVVLPGQRALDPGRSVRLINFVRSPEGALVPGECAVLKLGELVPTPSAKSESEPVVPKEESPAPSVPSSLAPAQSLPTPAQLLPAPAQALRAPAHAGESHMAFVDKKTRRALFGRAVDVAREFAEHIKRAGQIVTLDGRPYVTVSGWAILPAFENALCHPAHVSVEPDGTVIAEAVVEKDGQIVSRGFGACSIEEAINSRKKGVIIRKRPILNDRMAMAQTRARGAALKARYSVLVTLAGYEASLADEVQEASESANLSSQEGTQAHVASVPNRPASATPPAQPVTAAPKPIEPALPATKQQVEFALRIFEGDLTALLEKSAQHACPATKIEQIPVPVLKVIVEEQINERKRRRTESAATPTPASSPARAKAA